MYLSIGTFVRRMNTAQYPIRTNFLSIFKISSGQMLLFLMGSQSLAIQLRNLSFLGMIFPHLDMYITYWITAAYFNILWHNSFPAFFRYLNMAHDMDLAPSQLWFCKAIAAVLFTSSMCSTLFILSMTFERFYSIIRPHKAASFNTVKRAKISIVCIILFSIVYNSPLWLLSSQVLGQSRNCYAYANAMSSIVGQIYYWSANILHFILPFLLL